MLRYIYADQLADLPRLAETMFQDRAAQFHTRLSWDVKVDDTGAERDEYDGLNPLYIIWERPDGTHGGSLRMLPTTGQTMMNDHFLDLTDGVRIESPLIWECTRFCLAPGGSSNLSALLMLGVLELGLNNHLEHIAGIFDARMVRIYARAGWGPTILGTSGEGREAVSVGLWPCEARFRSRLLAKASVSSELSSYWYHRAFGSCAGELAKIA